MSFDLSWPFFKGYVHIMKMARGIWWLLLCQGCLKQWCARGLPRSRPRRWGPRPRHWSTWSRRDRDIHLRGETEAIGVRGEASRQRLIIVLLYMPSVQCCMTRPVATILPLFHFNNNRSERVKNVLYSSSSMLVFVCLGCGLHFGKTFDLQYMLSSNSLSSSRMLNGTFNVSRSFLFHFNNNRKMRMKD